MIQIYDLVNLIQTSAEEADGSLISADMDRATALAVAMCEPGETVTVHWDQCRAEFGDCTCSPPFPVTYGPKLSEHDWDNEETVPE